ncbi:MAG: cupin domain-containing protein [Halobacteriota archaeon]|uniref:cupin domain-containing protein n=1 Tax=Natronomonas sp. TaxID=2184060 RepID=UPI0039753F59
MKKVAVEDVEPVPHLMGINSDRRPISRVVDDMGFAMVVFELEPGETFSGAPHKHFNQEELFYVLEGTATFECTTGPGAESDPVEIGPNELIHFHADDVYQTGGNRSDDVVRGIAIGSPGARHEWEQTEALLECDRCGRETRHSLVPIEGVDDVRMPDLDEMVVTCKACGSE